MLMTIEDNKCHEKRNQSIETICLRKPNSGDSRQSFGENKEKRIDICRARPDHIVSAPTKMSIIHHRKINDSHDICDTEE